MSHKPEIFISTDKRVLEEINTPKTFTACWDAKGDPEFREILEYVAMFNNVVSDAGLENAKEWLVPASEYVQKELEGGINKIFTSMGINVQLGNPIRQLIQPPLKEYPGSKPHIDGWFLTAFFSFNEHVSGTSLVPKEYAGAPTNEGGNKFHDADVSKAVSLPGASIYLMKLNKQVHFAPQQASTSSWRVLERKSYEFIC